jgi:fucose 4-O-acetylase-like acetyltransferase
MTGLTLIAAWFLSVISSLATVSFDEKIISWIAFVVTGLSYVMYAFFHARGEDGRKVFTIIGLLMMLISHCSSLIFLQTKKDGSETIARSLVRCTAMLNNIIFTVILIVHNQEWVNTCMGKLDELRRNQGASAP